MIINVLGPLDSRRRRMFNRVFGAPGSKRRRRTKIAGVTAGGAFLFGFVLPVLLGAVIFIRRAKAEARHRAQPGAQSGSMPTLDGRLHPGTRRPRFNE